MKAATNAAMMAAAAALSAAHPPPPVARRRHLHRRYKLVRQKVDAGGDQAPEQQRQMREIPAAREPYQQLGAHTYAPQTSHEHPTSSGHDPAAASPFTYTSPQPPPASAARLCDVQAARSSPRAGAATHGLHASPVLMVSPRSTARRLGHSPAGQDPQPPARPYSSPELVRSRALREQHAAESPHSPVSDIPPDHGTTSPLPSAGNQPAGPSAALARYGSAETQRSRALREDHALHALSQAPQPPTNFSPLRMSPRFDKLPRSPRVVLRFADRPSTPVHSPQSATTRSSNAAAAAQIAAERTAGVARTPLAPHSLSGSSAAGSCSLECDEQRPAGAQPAVTAAQRDIMPGQQRARPAPQHSGSSQFSAQTTAIAPTGPGLAHTARQSPMAGTAAQGTASAWVGSPAKPPPAAAALHVQIPAPQSELSSRSSVQQHTPRGASVPLSTATTPRASSKAEVDPRMPTSAHAAEHAAAAAPPQAERYQGRMWKLCCGEGAQGEGTGPAGGRWVFCSASVAC